MNRSNIIILAASLFAFIVTVILGGCNEPELNSRWLDREITIDGRDTEWGNFIQYYDEKTRIILCIFNDEDYLYIKVSLPDPILQRQFMGMGFTVWFDSDGGKEKTFGINYPLGLQDKGVNMIRSGKRTNSPEDSEQFKKIIEESQNELKILGPGKDESCKMSMADAEKCGISVRIGKPNSYLVYELKVPLVSNESQQYGIGTEMKQVIGIGFETGKMDRKQMTGGRDREIWGGRDGMGKKGEGMSGRGAGRSGIGRGRAGMGGGKRQMFEHIEIWAKVTLVSESYIQ